MQVEVNDTVAVGTMSKLRPLPYKVIVDMAVSAVTKLLQLGTSSASTRS